MTKGLVKVSHGYSKVEFAKPGSLGNMTLPPRGESCNRTRHGGARRGWQAESNRKVLKTDMGEWSWKKSRAGGACKTPPG